ncbi:hypothetical protein [Bradyrhizobium macuxiense]|nr:hypothetical protein [Bradyrhizobium macuxiense]
MFETAAVYLLGVLFSVIEIAAIERVRWRSGDLIHGSPDLIGFGRSR